MLGHIKNNSLQKKIDSLPPGGQKTATMAQMFIHDNLAPYAVARDSDEWLGIIVDDKASTENEKKLASMARDAANKLMLEQLEKDNNTLTEKSIYADNYKIAARIERSALNTLAAGSQSPLAFSIIKVGAEVFKNIDDNFTRYKLEGDFKTSLFESLGVEKGEPFYAAELGVAAEKWIKEAPDDKEAKCREKEAKKIFNAYNNYWPADI